MPGMSKTPSMYEDSVFAGGMVVVKLGKMGQQTYTHKQLLQSRSPYFKRLLARRSAEKTVITLPDVCADTFCCFLSWLYANCFIVPRDPEWMGLCKLWLLAERFEVPALQNQVVEVMSCRLYQRKLTTLELELLHYVYDNSGPGSRIRMLFVHITMYYGNQDVLAQEIKDMPPVFHKDYAERQVDRAKKLAKEVVIHPWDLCDFLLPENVLVEDKETTTIKADSEGDTGSNATVGNPVGETNGKRRRTMG